MNFDKAEKEFSFAKRAYENGVINQAEYLNKIRNELLVQDENTGKWMLDYEKGNWLWFDNLNNEWIRRNRPGYKKNEEEYIIQITASEPPQIDEKIRKEILQYQNEEVINEPKVGKEELIKEEVFENIKEESTKKCNKCGQVVDKDNKFCPICGNKIEEKKMNFCRNCGKEIKEGNEFCIFCGTKN
ncbi:zinc ribbon domain-containing protein [Clostridium sp. DL1XJH146]